MSRDASRSTFLVGESASMAQLRAQVREVAPTRDTVLILGETGSGKELVARELHACSSEGRRQRPLTTVNCASLGEGTADSELFGSVVGAYTGATKRMGLFGEAEGGTLFLDELGELPLATQAKLLRAMLGSVRPVGGVEREVDVRIIAATNQDLGAMAQRGRFRPDVVHRFDVRLEVPPLRSRLDDVPALVAYFIAVEREREGRNPRAREASSDALARLRAHAWPGNVRELEAAVKRAMTRSRAAQPDALGPEWFDLPSTTPLEGSSAPAVASLRAVAERIIADIERGARPPATIQALRSAHPELDLATHLAEAFLARAWPDPDEAARRVFGVADVDSVRAVTRRRGRTSRV